MTADDRLKIAGLCVKNLGIELPALVDEPDNRVERDYTGWPDRLYVVDREGQISYKSAPGPFGFRPAEVETTLKRLLPATSRGRSIGVRLVCDEPHGARLRIFGLCLARP